jgi:hypothetical protein
MQRTGTTIPVVALTGDLVADHFAASMAHPGARSRALVSFKARLERI